MKKSNNAFFAIGLMLFALFFGAGNLIFPVFMGQNSGLNTIPATIGFLITGVGLPLLGVLAICYSGVNLRELASRIHPIYSLFFCTALYMTIGPCFAAPRTATVAYEIAVAQSLPPEMRTIGLYVFAAVFFIITWWLAISPSKMVDRVGKFMTPVLLLFLFLLIISAIVSPMGTWQAPAPAYDTGVKAFTQAIVDGYNTMDGLAALVFGIIVVESVKLYGAKTNEEITKNTLRSGLVSTFFMALIYAALCYLGANSVPVIGIQENGAPVLVKTAMYYFGGAGSAILGVIVIFACLTTSVGLGAFPEDFRESFCNCLCGTLFLYCPFRLDDNHQKLDSRSAFALSVGNFFNHSGVPRSLFQRTSLCICLGHGTYGTARSL